MSDPDRPLKEDVADVIAAKIAIIEAYLTIDLEEDDNEGL